MSTATEMPLASSSTATKLVSSFEESEFMTTTKTSTKSNSTSSSNGHAVTANGTAHDSEQLKILGHLKNIEIINEQRRAFLNKTVSASNGDEPQQATSQTVTEATTTTTTKLNGDVQQQEHSAQRSIISEQSAEHAPDGEQAEPVLRAKITIVPTASVIKPAATAAPILRSPITPPPKPPMLSRTRSVGVGDNRASLTSLGAGNTPTGQTPTTPILSTTITTTTLAEPEQIQTITVPAEQPAKKPTEQPAPTPPAVAAADTKVDVKLRHSKSTQQKSGQEATNSNEEKPINAKHYEHLIEELKCPGCAYPMKAPILLCETGHSVCEQCTRILMMCPLCKEPFTKIRSHTVEALCSKAHFRCMNGPGGCRVRLQKDLLSWHEKQCIYKPMKCFMGRVWGDCQWDGREIHWKEHLETEHADRVFKTNTTDLIWNMGIKQKPLTGYYVFETFDEMFNFYAIYDKERILYTMTCTSSVKDKKNYFAYEVTMVHPFNEALAITQKFPVHSEYDSDILMEGTCVSITLSDLAKFIDDDKLLHYRVRILEVNSPRKSKAHLSLPIASIPKDFQNTQISGVNLKNVPSDIIVTRREDLPLTENSPSPSTNGMEAASTSEDEIEKIRRQYNRKRLEDGDSESDPEFEAFIAKRWGTPQLHFNRKYLKNISSESSSNGDHHRNDETNGRMPYRPYQDDRISIASTNVSYTKKMSNTLRKSFRSIKSEFNGMRPFGKKSPEKILTP